MLLERLFFQHILIIPTFLFILEDGLYVSLSHIKNPDYSDDILRFQKLELKEIRK